MIPFDLEYYTPENTEEAVELFSELDAAGKEPLFYGGGTEIITLCRQQKIAPGALIDLKAIAETTVLEHDGKKLIIGANLNLNILTEQQYFPLLADVARCVADRTVRNRLTLGGNICGRLPYRETVIPFLLADANIVVAGPKGRRTEPLRREFDKRLRLNPGEILVQLVVDDTELSWPHWRRRREKHGPVDYPLFHLAAVRKKEHIAAAVSGLCAFPFRSEELEELINDKSLKPESRSEKSLAHLPGLVRSDDLGSDDYRQALWQKDLALLLKEMEEA